MAKKLNFELRKIMPTNIGKDREKVLQFSIINTESHGNP